MKKEAKIKKEIKKLNNLYASIPENKKELVQGLIENAAFMKVTLEELQLKVNEEGTVITSKNGNGFDVTQEHPAQKSYNTMINRYTAVMSKLAELLPDTGYGTSKIEEFLSD